MKLDILSLNAAPAPQATVLASGYSIVEDARATKLQRAMRDLYVECLGNVLKSDDAFATHVLMAPNLRGDHLVMTADDDDLREAVEAMTGREVSPLDCIVVLSASVLDVDRDEDAMTLLAAGDVAHHLNTLWPVADRSVGWVGKSIGWAAISSMLVCAHPVLRDIGKCGPGQDTEGGLIAQIHRVSLDSMERRGYRTADRDRNRSDMHSENKGAVTALSMVLKGSRETRGGYLTLPARAPEIVDAGRRLISGVVNDLDVRPIGVV